MAGEPSADPTASVDLGRLRAFLVEHDLLDGEPLDVSLLSGGRSNLTFLVTAGVRRLVLRRPPLGDTAPGAHDMSREYKVLHALKGTGLPIPVVHGFSDDVAIVGAPFYVMDHVAGLVAERRGDVAGRDAAWGRACSLAAVAGLARVHAVDTDAVGLGDFGRPENFLARRLTRWSEQWHASTHRDLPLFDAVARRLVDIVPRESETTLVHGDYRLGNLIIGTGDSDGDEPTLAAILDWEMSTRGDPLTDLAHLLVYWAPTCGRVTHESQEIAEQPGFLTTGELADAYRDLSGRDLANLSFYLAFEHWRAAVIKEGIHHRSLRGHTHGDGFAGIGASVPLHLEEAWEIVGGPALVDPVAI
ncbi:MAG: acyl-CoA dehydrogenase [Acidimicrobiales bacterium]|nr:acyl-CoA dehydrogenase [Acidimicrobiales bacterium]